MKLTKTGPLRTLCHGRWSIAVWTRPRFWKWLPCRDNAWSGRIRYWCWGPFVIEHDARDDVLGDLVRDRPRDRRAASEQGGE